MTRAARNGCVCADSNGTKCDVAAWNWEGFAAWTQQELWCPELTFGPVPPTFLNTGWAWYPSGPAGLHFRGCKYLNCGSLFQIYPGFNCFFSFYKPLTRTIKHTRNIRNECCTWRPHQKTEKPLHWKGNTVKVWSEKAARFQKTHLAYYSWCFMSACPTEII